MRKYSSLWLVLALVSSLALTACGSDKSDEDAKADKEKMSAKEEHLAEINSGPKIASVQPICPQVGIVRGLDVVRDYGNETAAPDQLVAAAKLLKTEGDCEYKDDGVDIAFKADMALKRGPRLGGNRVSFPIFVAVLNPAGDVLNKNQITVEVSFSGDEGYANHAEALHVFIPLAKTQQQSGPSYKVLTGFQLSPAQADQAKAALK